MTEFDFIRRYLNRQQTDGDVLLGIGDDAAIIRPRAGYDLCFSSDMLLGGRHFLTDVAPSDLAHKVLAVNVSDMAAMGAVPRWILLSVALPALDDAWLAAFCDSLFEQAALYGVTLIGGDTTKGDWAFNVTVVGELPAGQALRRAAAQVGDDIWVSGYIGSAAAALQHHLGRLVLPEAALAACEEALLRPQPRVMLGRQLLGLAHAAMDVSDGLAQDLGHILKASGVGAELQADRIPLLPQLRACADEPTWLAWQLAGGDDYELLFTAAESVREQIVAAGAKSGTAVTRIGKIVNGHRLLILDNGGREVMLDKMGFDHFG